jgi:hypothetical protein
MGTVLDMDGRYPTADLHKNIYRDFQMINGHKKERVQKEKILTI